MAYEERDALLRHIEEWEDILRKRHERRATPRDIVQAAKRIALLRQRVYFRDINDNWEER